MEEMMLQLLLWLENNPQIKSYVVMEVFFLFFLPANIIYEKHFELLNWKWSGSLMTAN